MRLGRCAGQLYGSCDFEMPMKKNYVKDETLICKSVRPGGRAHTRQSMCC